jgi:fructokinase
LKGEFSGFLLAGVGLGGTKCVATLANSPGDIVARKVVPITVPEETVGALERIVGKRAEWALGFRYRELRAVELQSLSPTYGYITKTTKLEWSGTDVAQRLARAVGVPTAFEPT